MKITFDDLRKQALEVRNAYAILEMRKYGKTWTREQIAEGFVGDVGDLLKLVLAKSGVREMDDVDQKMAHELADCLWAILILAHEYEIDLEEVFIKNMEILKNKISSKLD